MNCKTRLHLRGKWKQRMKKIWSFLFSQHLTDYYLAYSKTDILSVGSLVSFRKTDMPEHKRSLGIVNKVIVR